MRSTAAGDLLHHPVQATVVRNPSPPQAADLAKRLKAAGAKMYGAFWCSHCQEQKAEFGAEAQADLPYVECYPQGYHQVRAQLMCTVCNSIGEQSGPEQ